MQRYAFDVQQTFMPLVRRQRHINWNLIFYFVVNSNKLWRWSNNVQQCKRRDRPTEEEKIPTSFGAASSESWKILASLLRPNELWKSRKRLAWQNIRLKLYIVVCDRSLDRVCDMKIYRRLLLYDVAGAGVVFVFVVYS